MPLIPLDIPAGFYRNGTDLDASGRWRDGSLVRWRDGSLRPVGGWRERFNDFNENPVRGMHAWEANNQTAWVAGGSSTKLNAMTGANLLTDITPADLVEGRKDAEVETGYGYGFYGTSLFGQPRPDYGNFSEATTWSLDNFGEYLVACDVSDGRLLEWRLDTVKGNELVTNGDFAADSDWTKGKNWTISGGVGAFAQHVVTFNDGDVDAAADQLSATAHTLTDGDEVTYTAPAAPATAVSGLTDGASYFVVSATANALKLAATSGGTAIDLTRGGTTFDADDAAVTDVANDKIVQANTFTNGDYVTYSASSGVAIGGLTSGSNYYIVSATASEFQVSLTSGGAAIDLTANNEVTIDSADAAVVDIANDKIVIANTFSDGEVVTYSNGGGTDIVGLTDGTDYYIITSSATEFQLSLTSGGAAIDLTAVGAGAAHVFRQDIGSSHSFNIDNGDGHTLTRLNYENIDQTVSGLTIAADDWAHDIIVKMVDPNDDSDAATIPQASVKIVGTTTATVLVDEELSIGTNRFRFKADDTEVKVEIIPKAPASISFDVDDISLRQVPTALPIANAPTDNLGLIVTEERFLMALGAGGNPRKIAFSDREDNTQWAPSATNEAGDIELQTSGQIMTAIRTRGVTVILTDVDCHIARYIGPPYVMGFERIGTSAGIISRMAVADVDVGTFWMGQRSFYSFTGNSVQEVGCDVHDHVFGDMNTSQQSKIWAFNNGQYNEIWWFYPSSNSLEIDRYVAYNYKDQHWLIGELDRTSGVQRGVFKNPFLTSADSDLYDHEVGFNVNGSSIFAETGPISIGTGEQTMSVTKVIPDELTQGDTTLTFKTRFHPNDTERTIGPVDPSNPTSVRFTGRQARMRIEGDTVGPWRVGTMRVEAKPMGKR